MLRQHTVFITIGVALALLVVFGLVMLLGGDDGDDGDEQPEAQTEPTEEVRTDRLVAALAANPDHLDPHTATSPSALIVLDQVYETLVLPDADLRPQPGLANRWVVSEDLLTWTFTLRDDVVFHDGSQLTASDVVASLERVRAEGQAADRLAVVEEIEATGDHTVEFHLERPAANLPAHLGSSSRMAIVAEDALTGDDLTVEPVGTGPFRLASPPGADELVLERFDDHWGEQAPALEHLEFTVADAERALELLRDGELDWADAVDPGQVDEIVDDADLHLERLAGVEYWHLAFNLEREPFDQREVRHAVAFALDRDAIVDAVRPGGATVNQTPVPDGSMWHHDVAPFAHDPDLAVELLERVDQEELELELLVTDELPESEPTAEAIAAQLAEVGVDAEVRAVELEELLEAQGEGEFDAFALGWRGDLDPDEVYYPPHHFDGERNYQGFADEDIDDLLDEARQVPGPDDRKELYDAATELIVDRATYLYLYNPDLLQAWSADLEGVQVRPDGVIRFAGARLER